MERVRDCQMQVVSGAVEPGAIQICSRVGDVGSTVCHDSAHLGGKCQVCVDDLQVRANVLSCVCL